MASPGQLLDNHGCPECRSRSRGEKKIHNYLTVNKVNHVQQKEFSDCIDKSLLPFDFYLPKYNLIIEFMGKQHEIPIEFFGGLEAFKSRKMHDDIKFQYCVKNNIDYLDIWYYEYSDIDNIIIKKLNDIEKGIKYAVIK
jgi:hypothetical protein